MLGALRSLATSSPVSTYSTDIVRVMVKFRGASKAVSSSDSGCFEDANAQSRTRQALYLVQHGIRGP